MNKLKTIFIATILLSINPVFGSQNYTSYTQEPPINTQDSLKPIESVPTTSQEEVPAVQEQAVIKTELQKWNDHLTALAEADKGSYWDSNNNVPDNSWTSQAITFAENALEKDKTIAETLKTAFFDAIKAKITKEGGDLLSTTVVALINTFNDAIEAKLKALEDADASKEAAKTAVIEEIKPEPVIEQPTPAPVEPAPAPAVEEITLQETTTTSDNTSQDLFQKWDDLIRKIATEGTTFDETKSLISKTYELAKQMLPDISNPEILPVELKNALDEHNQQPSLSVVNINDVLTAFSEITGIPLREQLAYNQYDQESRQQTTATAKQKETEKQRMIAQKALDIARDREAEQTQESAIQKLQMQYQQKLAQFQATARAETDANLEKLRQELTKPHIAKAPEAPQGMIGSAIGAVKNAASAASRWWYGSDAVEEDQDRLKKLREITAIMALTDKEKQAIENNWKIFIDGLRSAPEHVETDKKWIATIGKALESLIMEYHILSIKDAGDIMETILEPSPNRTQIMREIKKYLKEQVQQKAYEKQQREAAMQKVAQQKKEKKESVIRKQQRIKDEENRVEAEKKKQLLTADNYKNEKNEWNQFLAQLSQNKQATVEENNAHTMDAIKKSQSLLNLAYQIPSKNRADLSQKLKQKFTVALLEQQKTNDDKINIHHNMDKFNKEINRITE
jgi:hypothetical protein